jgi:hypothetical protein
VLSVAKKITNKNKKMKALKYIISFAMFTAVVVGCKKDTNEDTAFASSINTPNKLKVLLDITQDNTGIVTITPNGEGVATFDIYYGDGTANPAKVMAGSSVKHTYTEGTFKIRIVGHSVTGQTAEATQDITVSFRKPENLEMTAVEDAANKFKINVKASALYETMFKVYFGETPTEIPLVFLEGETVSHTYTAPGTYTIKVVALSGGTATAEITKVVTITPAPKTQIDWNVTFDDATVDYTVTDFGGNATIDAKDPTNAANNVKKSTKTAGAATWAGTTIGTPIGFLRRLPITVTDSKMSVRVYSPAAGLHIRLKIEDHTAPTKSVETEALSTVANAWETLTFDFNNQATGTAPLNASYYFDMASIFFDFNVAGNDKMFYWDDVKFLGNVVVGNPIALPLDFQLATNAYTFVDFDGGNVTVLNNPFTTGINTSSQVCKMVKSPGQPWGGSFISLTSPINFAGAANKKFKMKVYSPRVGAKVLLKVENKGNSALNYEKEATTTVANAWEELTFDYSGINLANAYQNIVIIFELGTQGDGSANFTFYFDDISLN